MKKKLLAISLVITLIVGILTSVVMASSVSVTMTPSSTTVAESTELTVVLKVSNIDAGTNGINSVECVLSYDTTVFETLSSNSVDSLNDWTSSYSTDTGKIVLYKLSYVNSDEEIAQITLKTKSDTSGKTGSIKISNIVASNEESEIEVSNVSTTITVGSTSDTNTNTNTNSNTTTITTINVNTSSNTNTNTATNSSTNTSTNTNSNTNTNSVSSYVSSNSNTNNTSTTSTDDEIAYTGTSDNIMKAIFVVLIIAGISYFKYESIKG